MKRFLLCICVLLALCACQISSPSGQAEEKVIMEGFKEFYYTYDFINYNAKYQRYWFHEKDGKRMFFHDRREVVDSYGPAEEKDRTRFGEFELTEEEWKQFCTFLEKGTVRARSEEVLDGDDGPWLYLYRENHDPEGEEFYFDSNGTLQEFLQFCDTLADSER